MKNVGLINCYTQMWVWHYVDLLVINDSYLNIVFQSTDKQITVLIEVSHDKTLLHFGRS
jgi:hypothetical protein